MSEITLIYIVVSLVLLFIVIGAVSKKKQADTIDNLLNTTENGLRTDVCQSCGLNLAEGVTACPRCGTPARIENHTPASNTRTKVIIPLHVGLEQSEQTIKTVLEGHDFYSTTIATGESVWKKGTGLMTAMQFIKIDYSQDHIVASAWVQIGMGDIGAEEMPLTGSQAAIPKQALLKVLNELKTSL